MNRNYIIVLTLVFFSSLIFVGCNKDTNEIIQGEGSNDALIYSFSLKAGYPKRNNSADRAKDTIRLAVVNKTKYAIDQVNNTIYNPDSLPYGTVLEKVLISASYNPSYGVSSVKVITPDSTSGYIWNNSDSINFSKKPITFIVTSRGGTQKTYNIDVRIHKIDPDTIVWKQQSSYPGSLGESKTLYNKNASKFYTYTVSGGKNILYSSGSSAVNWKTENLSGLSAPLKTESLYILNNVFYAVDTNGASYKSSDGVSWTQVINSKVVYTILGILPQAKETDNSLLLLLDNGGQYIFAKSKDLITIEVVQTINGQTANVMPSEFPVKGTSSYTNSSTNENERMLILAGGSTKENVGIGYSWLIKNTSQGVEISSFTKNTLFKGNGISIFFYNSLLYAFVENQLYTSASWGNYWQKAPTKQTLPATITKRKGQTVLVDESENIWIFGGKDGANAYLKDVWKGRLNSLIIK